MVILQLWYELFNDLTPEMQKAVRLFGAE